MPLRLKEIGRVFSKMISYVGEIHLIIVESFGIVVLQYVKAKLFLNNFKIVLKNTNMIFGLKTFPLATN